jgi:hypothetical protein
MVIRSMRTIPMVVLLVMLTTPVWGATVFYQPQSRDSGLGPAQWSAIWEDLKRQGHDGLVVQWTQFNDEDFGGSTGWLAQVIDSAMEAGLETHIGMYWNDAWFESLHADGSAWGDRLNLMLQRNLDTARKWQHLAARKEFAGWYLPLELPDRGLHGSDRRALLKQQVTLLAEALEAPLAVSSYFTGFQSPRDYARWLETLAEEAGVTLWVQDGAGVKQLTSRERPLYLELLDCRIGIIREAFEQTSAPDEPFSARPKAPEAAVNLADCHETLLFSLRYIAAGNALPL